jgi:small-conductance mechanosensitive channel
VIGLVSEFKDKLDRALTTVVMGVIAAAAGVTAFFLLCVGLFVWTAHAYDTVTACVVLAVLFLVIAAVAVTVIVVARRRAAERLRRRESRRAPLGLDPAMIALGVEIAKTLGPRRIASIAVLGALVAGIMLNRPTAAR